MQQLHLEYLQALTRKIPKLLLPRGNSEKDYSRFLVSDGLKGKRIGLLKKSMGFHEKVDTLMLEAVRYMKANGAVIVEVELPKVPNAEEFEVLLYEFKDGVNKYLAGTSDVIKTEDSRRSY